MKNRFSIMFIVLCFVSVSAYAVPPDMVLIPSGEFEMGDNLNEGYPRELPVHPVYVDSFYMGKYEITNSQYCEFLNALYPSQLKVVSGIVYASSDISNSCPYFDTNYELPEKQSQIEYSNGVFSVRTKQGRTMSNDPVVMVSWCGAPAYCNWRSQQEGKEPCYDLSTWECDFTKNGYRLPTEAEWEYAARGGLSGKRFPWGDTISHTQANYFSDSSYSYDISPTRGMHPLWNDGIPPYGINPYTSPVGFFDGSLRQKSDFDWPGSLISYQTTNGANGYGLYDMTGNVWERCNDWHSDTYYSSSPYYNPRGPVSGSFHVLRGGGHGDLATNCRIAFRNVGGGAYTTIDVPYGSIGFRVVRFNKAPTANAGPDQTVYGWIDGIADVTLDGSGSSDPDGDELTYTWTWTIGSQSYTSTGVNPTIELSVGLHTIELIVNDGTQDSAPDQVVIAVVAPFQANLWITPRVINRNSCMPNIMALLRLPAGISKGQIDTTKRLLLYPGEIEANWQYVLQSQGRDGPRTSIFAFFDKAKLMEAVPENGSVELKAVGQLKTGQYFYGTDTVLIINPPTWRPPGR